MKAVILAGGLGSRLKPLTQIIPKPLLPIGESSILEITIQRLKSSGFKEIILAVNYKSHLFESYFNDGSRLGVKISYSKENKPLGTAGPVKLAENQLTTPFLVMNGDILTNLDFAGLREFHIKNRADFTLATKILKTPLHYGVVISKGETITKLQEKPMIESEINAGIYFVNPEALKYIPKDRFYNMTDLIKRLIKEKKRVLRYVIKDYWLDIGQMDDYHKAQSDIKKRFFNK